MKALFDEINEKFPVRNSKEQKEAFRDWALNGASECGLNASVSDDNGHRNLVIGNIESAEVIFTAHYDTPWQSPWPNLMLPYELGWVKNTGKINVVSKTSGNDHYRASFGIYAA